MTDYFAVLHKPRRPWLDADSLKEKFLSLSAMVHPDRVHGLEKPEQQRAQDCYTELNAAYNCLREPKSRLRHLIELERGSVPKEIQNVPNDLVDIFMEVAQAFRQVDAFLAEKNRAISPILKVQFMERSEEWMENLRGLKNRLNSQRTALLDELKSVDSLWISNMAGPPGLLPRLESLFHLFGYSDRWRSQLQERLHQLAF